MILADRDDATLIEDANDPLGRKKLEDRLRQRRTLGSFFGFLFLGAVLLAIDVQTRYREGNRKLAASLHLLE